MPDVFFENEQTKLRYKFVSLNKETGIMTLLGPHGVEFDVPYSKENFVKWGYHPVTDNAAPAPPAAAVAAPPPPVPQAAAA